MGRRSSRIGKNKPRPSRGVQSSLPPALHRDAISSPRWRRLIYLGLVGLAVAVCTSAVWFVIGRDHHESDVALQEEVQAELRLGERFRDLKNGGDPAADELIAPMSTLPDRPLSQDEANCFQTECFLHQNIRIVSVGLDSAQYRFRRLDSTRHLVLVTEGNVSAPTLQVKTATGVESRQRTMANPDLIVEVRDGKIHGVCAQMHRGP